MVVSSRLGMVNRAEIKRRRKAKKWTIRAACEAAGWDAERPARWHSVESGQTKDPQLSTLEGMAKALDCTVCDILK